MSFDKTDIIVQTLESQIDGLRGRSSQFSREALEHDGAKKVCGLIAQESLSLLGVVESRLSKEDEDVDEATKDLIRIYAKNLIKHFHTIATSNGTNQGNQSFITRGRSKEAETQADILVKEIASQKAFVANREAEVEAEAEDKFDNSDIETPVIVEGTKLPKEPEPLPEPTTPGPVVDSASEPEPPSEEPTNPGKTTGKKPNRRKLSRGKK